MPIMRKGKVVNTNHQRRFGFVEEEKTKVQYFFHFSQFGAVNNRVTINGKEMGLVYCAIPEITYPQLGDIIYFYKDEIRPSPRVLIWVYEADYISAQADFLKKLYHNGRTKPEPRRQRQQQSGPFSEQSSWTKTPPPPPPKPNPKKSWREVLKFGLNERVSADLIERRFRHLAKTHHPDFGGSHEKMVELNLAKREAMRFAI